LVAALLKTFLIVLAKALIEATAASAIKTSNSAYSVKFWPASSRQRPRRLVSFEKASVYASTACL